jgi:hypothetical protein
VQLLVGLQIRFKEARLLIVTGCLLLQSQCPLRELGRDVPGRRGSRKTPSTVGLMATAHRVRMKELWCQRH